MKEFEEEPRPNSSPVRVHYPGSIRPRIMYVCEYDEVWGSNVSILDALENKIPTRLCRINSDGYECYSRIRGIKQEFEYVIPAVDLSYIYDETEEYVDVRTDIDNHGDRYTGGFHRYYKCPLCTSHNYRDFDLKVTDAPSDRHFAFYGWDDGRSSVTSCRDERGELCNYIRFFKQ